MLQTEVEEFEQTKKEHIQQTRLKKTFVDEPQQTPVRSVDLKKFQSKTEFKPKLLPMESDDFQ
jgi:hypothetical protein